MLLYSMSYGLHGYIIQGDSRLLQGMIQVTGYIGVPCIYYREVIDGLFGSFGHTFVPHTGSISIFQSIQVDGSLLLQGSPLYMHIFIYGDACLAYF